MPTEIEFGMKSHIQGFPFCGEAFGVQQLAAALMEKR
jgi:hypothetical protein